MKIGFLFPGQGAQSVGMGKDFYERYEIVKNIFDTSKDILSDDITRIMFEGPEQELKNTKNAQLAVFILSYAISRLLRDACINPEYVAGHSLGEYTALVVSGALSYEDGLKLIKCRGELMAESAAKNPGNMAAIIGLERKVVEEICNEIASTGKTIVCANYNSKTQIVISGSSDAIDEAVTLATQRNAKRVVVLPVSGAFHSPLMQDAQIRFMNILKEVEIKDASVPIIANTSAIVIRKKEEIKEELEKHMISSVKWCDSMLKMIEFGVDIFIEVGPGRILKGLMLDISKEKTVYTTFNIEELENTLKCFKQF